MTDISRGPPVREAGAEATILYQGRRLKARMSDALPQFDPQSRTLKFRFEFDNPGYVLQPDMFVDVEFEAAVPPAVTVPAEAVLDSGLRKTVFVDRGNGYSSHGEWRRGGARVSVCKSSRASCPANASSFRATSSSIPKAGLRRSPPASSPRKPTPVRDGGGPEARDGGGPEVGVQRKDVLLLRRGL